MLQAVANIAPRGVYVCGNTTTTSGLTVSPLILYFTKSLVGTRHCDYSGLQVRDLLDTWVVHVCDIQSCLTLCTNSATEMRGRNAFFYGACISVS